jgi:hypothetical protein
MSSLLLKWGMDPAKIPPPIQQSLEPIVRFFSYHDAHPVALTLALMEKFGADWFEWEAETLKSEILQSFKATSVSENNWQKIQAVRTLTTTVGFWQEWHIFEKIIQALNNNVPRFDISQRCTISQLMAGVDIANTIRVEAYGDEISRYIAACAIDEAVEYLPPPLDFAQSVLSEPKYRCKRCGTIELDDIDGRCDFCTARFQDDRALNFKPADFVPQDAGRSVDRFLTRDPAPTKARFEQLLNDESKSNTLKDDVSEDVQAAKLMVAYDYMKKRQQELVDQLEELKAWAAH